MKLKTVIAVEHSDIIKNLDCTPAERMKAEDLLVDMFYGHTHFGHTHFWVSPTKSSNFKCLPKVVRDYLKTQFNPTDHFVILLER